MNATAFNGFDDLGDDFDAQPATSLPATLEDASQNKSLKDLGKFQETCTRCNGSGRYHRCTEHGTVCLKCKGAGKLYFKTSSADRKAKRAKAVVSKANKADVQLAKFEAENPEIASWWNGANRDFQFAVSLRDWVRKHGTLSEAQSRAAMKCIANLAAIKAASVERAVHAAEHGKVDVSCIVKAIDKAASAGLKNPKIRLLAGDVGIIVYRASANSANAGSLYVKSTGEGDYLGKITKGIYMRGRGVSDDLETNIVKACSSLPASAVAYGRATGTCSCCGRELTDPESIARGIGPICEAKFF